MTNIVKDNAQGKKIANFLKNYAGASYKIVVLGISLAISINLFSNISQISKL